MGWFQGSFLLQYPYLRVYFWWWLILNVGPCGNLHTFKFLKNNWKIEDYLLTVENISDRTSLSKFRLSDHSFLIEKGRHQNIISSKRTCPFCPGHVENEFHFLIKCHTYTNLLHDTETLCIGFFYPPDEEFLLWFLMNNPIISDSIAKFVHLSMELRAFLLENHRNGDWINYY